MLLLLIALLLGMDLVKFSFGGILSIDTLDQTCIQDSDFPQLSQLIESRDNMIYCRGSPSG